MAGKRTPGTLIKSAFVDATRLELNDAYKLKTGNDPVDGFSDEELREVVKALWGTTESGRTATMEPVSDEPQTPINQPKLKGIPNLSISGKWGGRMRRVTIIKRETEAEYSQPLGWNGVIWNAPVGIPLDMPWPYWESLKNTSSTDYGSEAVAHFVTESGGKAYKVSKPKTTQTIRYMDHGDVEDTQDLATSYWDFFRNEALKNDCFKGKNRSTVIGIHNKLFEPQSMWNFRDMKDHDIRMRIAMCLGSDIESLMENEAYEQETA